LKLSTVYSGAGQGAEGLGHSLFDSPTMKVVFFVAFILLKFVSAKDLPIEPEVQEVMPTSEVDWPIFSTEKIQDKVDQIANEALYQRVQDFFNVPLDWISKMSFSAPLDMIQKYSKTSYAQMTKAGNGLVKVAAESAPYVVALTFVAGAFYLIMTLVGLVFNTKANLMRLASGYVNDNLNLFREEVPQLMQRMMPEMNLDILDVIEKMKQKFE